MDYSYINHRSYVAQNWWERRKFVHNWWRIYRNDPYWVPPHYPTLRHVLEPDGDGHLARMRPLLIHTEALPRRRDRSSVEAGFSPGPMFERPVAATVALCDPRRRDRTAYLAHLHGINDADSLGRHLESLAEAVRATGCRRVIGPTALSPHLGSGLLQDHWNQVPPLHTPYDPPYLPEIVNIVLEPLDRQVSRLYHLQIPKEGEEASPAPAELLPLEPARLATDLLPLLVAACPAWADFPPPDEQEATFLLRWLDRWPLFGWLARVDGQPVGFVLLQPDLAPRLQRAKGGRPLLWRLWLAQASRRRTRRGRVLFAGVLPDWRGRGIGRQLLHQARLTARQRGWQRLTIGPIPDQASGRKFLEQLGAEPRQTYRLYHGEF